MFDEAAVDTLFDSIVSHALTLGYFDSVNTHEPKSAPGNGLVDAIWIDSIGSVRSSGLSFTSGLVVLKSRIYSNMLQQPQDIIDPNITKAVTTLLAVYSGDFDLGETVRCIDLLGISGQSLGAQAGYLNMDNRLYRVMTVTIPVIINDMWSQA